MLKDLYQEMEKMKQGYLQSSISIPEIIIGPNKYIVRCKSCKGKEWNLYPS